VIKTSTFQFEYLMAPPYGLPGWHRSRFKYRPETFGITEDPPGDDEAMAREMLSLFSHRYRPGTRFRLVRVTEEVFDHDEIVSIEHGR
jgi:hypothetical protein